MKKFENKHNNLLNLLSIHNEFNVPKKGIIHIGAHFGSEIVDYNEVGYNNILFAEASSKTFEVLKQNTELNKKPNCNLYLINKAFGSYLGEVEMFIETSNQGQSSSILEPSIHLSQYPNIVFTHKESVTLTTLDEEIKNINVDFNILNVDVQGYELEVLKGSINILPKIDFINTEVNRAEVYKNCPMITDIDSFLYEYGFTKIDENWMGDTWGDAMYIKTKFL